MAFFIQITSIFVSMCCTEYTPYAYLETFKTLEDRIKAIDVLIENTLLLMADTSTGIGGNISMYELDDGQVRIKTGYRSLSEVTSGIKSLETLQQIYLNRLRGRATVLIDRKIFQRGYRGGCR